MSIIFNQFQYCIIISFKIFVIKWRKIAIDFISYIWKRARIETQRQKIFAALQYLQQYDKQLLHFLQSEKFVYF